jgi:repressor LexA
MAEMSQRQKQVLDLIRTMVAQRGYPPSVREIGEALGLSSPSTVHSHLTALVRAGLLRRDPAKPRAIEVLDQPGPASRSKQVTRQVPLLGRIAAGSPILAVEDVEDVFTLPTQIAGKGPVFMLRIKGDSMIEAGILDGDLVVVEKEAEVADGEIVAALVDGEEATVKRLRRRGESVILEPANPNYRATTYKEGISILGKVVSVLRRL